FWASWTALTFVLWWQFCFRCWDTVGPGPYWNANWCGSLLICLAPFLLLSPVSAGVARSLSGRSVLMGTAGLGLILVLVDRVLFQSKSCAWLLFPLAALGSAALRALVPAVARQAHLSVN